MTRPGIELRDGCFIQNKGGNCIYKERTYNRSIINQRSYFRKISPDCVVIYETLWFDVAQGRMNGAPIETRTHSFRFVSLVC